MLDGNEATVEAVAINADGATAVSGDWIGAVRVWDLSETAAARVLTGHDATVEAVAISADGGTVVSGGWDGTVRVWDTDEGSPLVTWWADTGVRAVAIATVVVASDAVGRVHALRLHVSAAAPKDGGSRGPVRRRSSAP